MVEKNKGVEEGLALNYEENNNSSEGSSYGDEMDTVREYDSSGESCSEINEQARGKRKMQKERVNERAIWQYKVKGSWEDESLVEGDGGVVEEGEEDGEEDQSISTKASREIGDTLVIKGSTDTSNKAYVPTSSDSEESVKSEPTKHIKKKKQTTTMK